MKLSKFIKLSGLKRKIFAKKIGVTTMAVDHWINGRRFPRIEFLRKIQKITRGAVTPMDFYETSGR